MGENEQPLHFGLNCVHLRRDDHPPADCRCAKAIDRYAGAEYAFLESKAPVPLEDAARILGIPADELARRAKAGEFKSHYPDNVSKRTVISTESGPLEVTLKEAAKRLKISDDELERRIAAGEMTAYYPDKFMHVVVPNRWEYEKCPLVETGGICLSFQPHDGPKISCIADVDPPEEAKS